MSHHHVCRGAVSAPVDLRVVEGADPYRLVWVIIMPIGEWFPLPFVLADVQCTPPTHGDFKFLRRGDSRIARFCFVWF